MRSNKIFLNKNMKTYKRQGTFRFRFASILSLLMLAPFLVRWTLAHSPHVVSALAINLFNDSPAEAEPLTTSAALRWMPFPGKVQEEPQAQEAPPLARLAFTQAELARALESSGDFLPEEVSLESGLTAHLAIDPHLQREAERLMEKHQLPYGAIVAIEPSTGKVITMAGSSRARKEDDSYRFALRSGMPAASLIKVISAAAAIEKGGARPNQLINYRGGVYTLNKWNYKPDRKLDTRTMSLEKALATSCNPVFGRLGLEVTGADLLGSYAQVFGFNRAIPFELPLERSVFTEIIDDYALARTAAGFGDVYLSPLHAALVMASIANEGVMMRPMLVKELTSADGRQRLQATPQAVSQVVSEETAATLMEMMELTITEGTGRRHFSPRRAPVLRGKRIAAKTGTLTGPNPQGRYHWLIAAAPVEKPEIAIATLVVDPGNARINGTALGRLFLEVYFAAKKKDSKPI